MLITIEHHWGRLLIWIFMNLLIFNKYSALVIEDMVTFAILQLFILIGACLLTNTRIRITYWPKYFTQSNSLTKLQEKKNE